MSEGNIKLVTCNDSKIIASVVHAKLFLLYDFLGTGDLALQALQNDASLVRANARMNF